MNYLVEVKGLRKQYGALVAVDDVSFGIRPGICFGLLGPNGAGKSTIIEMIEGIKPTSGGDILYRGKPRDQSFSQQCGIQFQSTALPDFLTVEEVLKLFSRFYRHSLAPEMLVELCDLGEFYRREANKLSGGQKQRLLLALALINDPQIVFLDEPTTGLDPQSRRRFWQLIETIRAQGKTIVLTTHYMDEAETLCDELVIIDHGRIVDQGSPRSLLSRHLPYKQVHLDCGEQSFSEQGISGKVSQFNGSVRIETLSVEKTVQELIAKRVDLTSLRVHNPTLEDLFIQLTGHALRD